MTATGFLPSFQHATGTKYSTSAGTLGLRGWTRESPRKPDSDRFVEATYHNSLLDISRPAGWRLNRSYPLIIFAQLMNIIPIFCAMSSAFLPEVPCFKSGSRVRKMRTHAAKNGQPRSDNLSTMVVARAELGPGNSQPGTERVGGSRECVWQMRCVMAQCIR